MNTLISVLVSATIAFASAAILFPKAVHIRQAKLPDYQQIDRIQRIEGLSKGTAQMMKNLEESGLSIAQRLLKSPSIRAGIEDRLRRARLDGHVTAVEYICVRIILAFLVVSIWIGLSLFTSKDIPVYLFMILTIVVFQIPDYLLEQRAKRIDGVITQELPQTIDMLLICADSGMGLMQSIEVVAEKKGGLIGRELQICLQEINLGVRLQEALHNLNKRCRSRELQMFVNSITQALRMGTPVHGVLRNLSVSIRDSERQRLESKIGSIPMKLTVATMVFFMPLIFIIVLFPSLLSFMQSGW